MPLNQTSAPAGASGAAVTIPQIPCFDLLGVRFNTLSMEETLNFLEMLIAARKPVQISFANAQTVAACWSEPFVREVINRSDYTFPDGMSIVWGGRWLGRDVKERIAGPDITARLCQRAAEKGYRVFLLGTSEENLIALSDELRRSCPGLQIVGTYSPPMCAFFNDDQSRAMITAVNASRADVLFVGLSCPKQEKWIGDHIHELTAPVSLGVGAAFDFLSGRIPRAPRWLQVSGLEWLHRLLCEPRRLWRRYLLGNAVFLSLLAAERFRVRLLKRGHRP